MNGIVSFISFGDWFSLVVIPWRPIGVAGCCLYQHVSAIHHGAPRYGMMYCNKFNQPSGECHWHWVLPITKLLLTVMYTFLCEHNFYFSGINVYGK